MRASKTKMSIEQFEEIACQHIEGLSVSHYITDKAGEKYFVSKLKNINGIYDLEMLEANNYININMNGTVYCISKYELYSRHLEFIGYLHDYITSSFPNGWYYDTTDRRLKYGRA